MQDDADVAEDPMMPTTPMSTLILDVGRAVRLIVGRYVGETSTHPYNHLRLLELVKAGGYGSQSALAERLFQDPPAVSRAVDKLETEGLLTRTEGQDRRCVKLQVTADADAVITHIDDAHMRLDGLIERVLTPAEQATLRTLLEKLDEGLRTAS